MAAPKTVITYDLDGSNRDFEIPFEYLARKFIVVTLIGTDRLTLTLTTDYRFSQRTIITTVQAWGPAQGYNRIEIRRVTSATERLVDFSDGSVLRAYDLNTSNVQSLHIAEEGRDIATDTIGVDNNGDLDARGRKLVNLADAVNPGDAVPLRQVMNWDASALTSAIRAEAAKVSAEAAAVRAVDSAADAHADAVVAAQAAVEAAVWGSHSIRTPLSEQPLRELPIASLRANSIMGFDDLGNVILAGPVSGDASDLAIQLAGTEGVVLVGNALDKRDLKDPAKAVAYKAIEVVVDNVAAARLLDLSKGVVKVSTRGYYVPGDRGHAEYTVVPGGTAADNGGHVLLGVGGNLLALHDGIANLRQWGLKGDGVTNDTAALLRAVASKLPLYVPPGRYLVSPYTSLAPYPPEAGTTGPVRTSAAVLWDNQHVFGHGAASEFLWDYAAGGVNQCFFKVDNAKDITFWNVKFFQGHSAVVIDPIANGSVSNVGMHECILDNQALGFLGGRQIALDPVGSKSASNLWVRACIFRRQQYHAVLFTNCDRARALDNDFTDNTNGFCVDFSQGVRGAVFTGNTGFNVLYVMKVESSVVAPGTADGARGSDIIVANNTFTGVIQWSCLINSAHERLIIHGNVFNGSSNDVIMLGEVTGVPHSGQIIISSNVLKPASTGTGVTFQITTNTQVPILDGNSIYGGQVGVRMQTSKRLKMRGNDIQARENGLLVDVGITYLDLSGNTFTVTNGAAINAQPGNTWQAFTINHNTFNVATFALYGGETNSFSSGQIIGNRINCAVVRPLGLFMLNNMRNTIFALNLFNVSGGSHSILQTTGATWKSVISGNIGTVGLSIAAPDPATAANTVNNIIDAPYVA